MTRQCERVVGLSPREKGLDSWLSACWLTLPVPILLFWGLNRLRSAPLAEDALLYLLSSVAGKAVVCLGLSAAAIIYIALLLYLVRKFRASLDSIPEYHLTESGFSLISPSGVKEYYAWHSLQSVSLVGGRLTFDSGAEVELKMLTCRFLNAAKEVAESDNLIKKEMLSWNMAALEHRTQFWRKFWKTSLLIDLVFALGLTPVVAVTIYDSESSAVFVAILAFVFLCTSVFLSSALHSEEYRKSRPF